MKELTPAQKALNKYRTAMTEVVVTKQRETAAAMACHKAQEEFSDALTKSSQAQDAADRARGELEELLAPADDPTATTKGPT